MKGKYCKIQKSNTVYLIEDCKDNTVILNYGNVKVKTDISNISIMPEDFVPQKRSVKSTVSISSENIPNEIMLRHKFKDEAIAELDKYIDQAIVAKLGRVRIIHGRHGGILRQAVHEYLKGHPYVKEYYIAGYGEGGIGVTVAILGRKN